MQIIEPKSPAEFDKYYKYALIHCNMNHLGVSYSQNIIIGLNKLNKLNKLDKVDKVNKVNKVNKLDKLFL